MATTLIFIRHGESEANFEHRFTGQSNAFGLTERGHAQAQAAAEAYRRHREQVLESYRERAAAATTPEARRRLRQEVWSKRHECPEALRTVEQTLRAQETQTFYNE
jgi:broad specificity phosphatase PhoE